MPPNNLRPRSRSTCSDAGVVDHNSHLHPPSSEPRSSAERCHHLHHQHRATSDDSWVHCVHHQDETKMQLLPIRPAKNHHGKHGNWIRFKYEPSAFSTKTQSRFVSVVLEGVLGPPCLVPHMTVSMYLWSSGSNLHVKGP